MDVFPDLELSDELDPLMNLGIKSERLEVSDQIEEEMRTKPVHGSELSSLTSKSTGDEHLPSPCRLCANPGDDLINMSDHSELHKYFVEKIEFCLPTIEMEKTDNLTKKACQLCLAQLELCYQFLKAVAKADKKLRLFDREKSNGRRRRNENIRTPPPCIGQCDTVTHDNDEETFDITPTFFADELPITDARVRSNLISSNLNHSVDEDGRTNSSDDTHRDINSSTNTLNSSRLVPRAGQGTSRSPPNHSVHSDEELGSEQDASDSEPYALPLTRRGQALTTPKIEAMEDNNTVNLSSCKNGNEEKDRKEFDTESKKMKGKSVLNNHNKREQEFVSKSELAYQKLCSYESSGEPCERQDSGKVMDTKRTLQKIKASSRGRLALAEKNKYSCAHCKKTFNSKSVLAIHVRIHTAERPYGCEFCGRMFRYTSDRDRHRRRHTGERPYSCEFCGRTFRYTSDRDRHRRKHTGERPYVCDLCTRTFTCARDIRIHRSSHTGDQPHSCDFSSKTFVTASNRMGYPRIYADVRPLKCYICHMTFQMQSALDNHVMRHLEEDSNKVMNSVGSSEPGRFICAHCGLSHKSKANLVIHMRTHTGERPFGCDFCPKTFSRASNRNRHHLTHTGERPGCSVCEKTFRMARSKDILALRNSLKHHRTHAGERPFECAICEKTFKKARSRDVHAFKHIINNDDGAMGIYGTISCNLVGQSEETQEENSSRPNLA